MYSQVDFVHYLGVFSVHCLGSPYLFPLSPWDFVCLLAHVLRKKLRGVTVTAFLYRECTLSFRDRAISSELHAELMKGNRQVCWRFLRRLFRLFQARSSMNIPTIERLFQLCATSDEGILQVWEQTHRERWRFGEGKDNSVVLLHRLSSCVKEVRGGCMWGTHH